MRATYVVGSYDEQNLCHPILGKSRSIGEQRNGCWQGVLTEILPPRSEDRQCAAFSS